MKANVLHSIGDLRYETVDTPVAKDNEVLVKVKAAGICGSDIGRVLVKGTYSFPLIPGHEFSGQIVETGGGVSSDLVGKKVAVFPLIPCQKCNSCQIGQYAQCEDYDYIGSRCNGAFSEYVAVPVWNLVFAPNDKISYEQLALLEPTAIALHALRLAKVDIDDTVAIFGCGPIGLLMGMIAKNTRSANVIMIDVDQTKVDFAKSLGFENTINSLKTDPIVYIKDSTKGIGADVCLEGAGVSISIENCLSAVRKFGKIIAVGTPHKDLKISMQAYEMLLRKQVSLTGTWNSVYSELPKNEWITVAKLISSNTINVSPLVSHRVRLSDGIAPIKMMADRKTFFNKVMYIMD